MLTAFVPAAKTNSPFGDWTTLPSPFHLDLCARHGVFHGEFQCRL